MKNDPTQEEMSEFLLKQFEKAGIEGIIDNIFISTYWFARNFYNGQFSNLYSALCGSFYKPGILTNNVENEEDIIIFMMYNSLVEEFLGEDSDQFLLDEHNNLY